MVGLDARYRKDAGDEEIAATAAAEARIVLTRDRVLLKRSQVAHGYCVREDDPERQLFEVISRFHLFDRLRPFTRCMRCNGVLEPVAREEVWERLPQQVREFYTEYTRCPACGGVYWRGTHYDRMREKIQR
ncbi:MAG: Mut7-C RNAse domain-containing protein, partial [Syntrophomonadaceae bacterium]|nr:Mut7-C RNAse domain-containing protein [Syntrophomonadaceae bacterium]